VQQGLRELAHDGGLLKRFTQEMPDIRFTCLASWSVLFGNTAGKDNTIRYWTNKFSLICWKANRADSGLFEGYGSFGRMKSCSGYEWLGAIYVLEV
jgi:hypothetical protein